VFGDQGFETRDQNFRPYGVVIVIFGGSWL